MYTSSGLAQSTPIDVGVYHVPNQAESTPIKQRDDDKERMSNALRSKKEFTTLHKEGDSENSMMKIGEHGDHSSFRNKE